MAFRAMHHSVVTSTHNVLTAVLVLFLMCQVFQATSAQDSADVTEVRHPHVRTPVFSGSYGLQAQANLSTFRSQLLSKNAVLFKPNHNLIEDNDKGFARYDMYKPFLSCPPWRPLGRVGSDADGGKIVCSLKDLKPPCIIYSLGSNMQFDFEEGVLRDTVCHVHTFDCTVEGKVLDPARHAFHKVCIGDPSLSTPERPYDTYSSITRRLGHHRVTMLKMDIEGYEFQALGELRENSQGLPEQIAVELHFTHPHASYLPEAARRQEQMTLVFMHLANLGYGIVSYEPNAFGADGCCAEFTFMRVEHDVTAHARQRRQRRL